MQDSLRTMIIVQLVNKRLV